MFPICLRAQREAANRNPAAVRLLVVDWESVSHAVLRKSKDGGRLAGLENPERVRMVRTSDVPSPVKDEVRIVSKTTNKETIMKKASYRLECQIGKWSLPRKLDHQFEFEAESDEKACKVAARYIKKIERYLKSKRKKLQWRHIGWIQARQLVRVVQVW